METVTLQPLQSGSGQARARWLHVGSWTLRVPVVRHPEAAEVWVPPVVFSRLPLTPRQRIGCWESPDGQHLHLGPLVGLVVEGSGPAEPSWVAGERARLLLEGAHSTHCAVAFFSILDVDLERSSVMGSFQAGGEWRRCTLPLPDVIYNRGTYPDPTQRLLARSIRRQLRRALEIPFINPVAALSKWETYRALRFFPQTRDLVPETVPFDGADAVAAMLERHGTVYIKAEYGSHGSEVLRVEGPRWAGGKYKLNGYLRQREERQSFSDLTSLCQYLGHCCQGLSWVVQQGIALERVRNRIWDLRAVLQKDDQERWQIPHLLVRWAQPGSVVTNTSQGADSIPLDQFLLHFWIAPRENPAALVARIREMSHQAALALEARYGLLGELGLDIGVDRKGRLWLFEANAKPFMDPGEGSYYPFRYARALATKSWAARYAALAAPLEITHYPPPADLSPGSQTADITEV